MRRVDSAGSGFLYGETAGWHMHVGALMVLDPSEADDFSFEKVKRLYAERMGGIPDLAARLREVPLGLDRPVLGHDPTFDVDAHCRRVSVPAPGTNEEFGRVLGSIMGTKIDRHRPLWEMWWIDGLADGRVGVFVKMHHALIDGYSGMQLAALVMDLEPSPDADTVAAMPHPPPHAPAPSALRLGAEATRTLAALPWRSVRYVNQLAHQAVTMVRHARRPESPPMAFAAPRTRFNLPISSRRIIATCSLPMRDILTVKQAFGTSVNDVLLAVVGGALRTHLHERGELPDASLVAQVPVSVHKAGDEELGTQVANMFTTLATDIAESAERLRVVAAVTSRAKEFQHELFADRAVAIPELVPPIAISVVSRLFTGLGLERHVPPVYNAIVSDVRGSPVDLYVAGARVDAIHPFGPLLLGTGLNITALSHCDRLNIGILATPESLPDPWSVAAAMEEELAELLAAAADLQPADVDLVAAEVSSGPGDRSPPERSVPGVTITAPPWTPVGRAAKRMGGVALDLLDIGRRTYDFAQPLGSAEPPVSTLGQAQLIAAAGADELVLTLMRQVQLPSEEQAFGVAADELPRLVKHLEERGAFADPASWHVAPDAPDLHWSSRSVIGRGFEQVTFTSPYAPPDDVPGATRYAQQTQNTVAHAWIVRQDHPAPWVVCVHGAGMGDPMIDLLLFRAHALHRQGFNVAIAVLPHHGPRGLGRFEGSFPGVDVVANLHGASQAIADVRAVLAWVADRGEAAALYGISLGGYVASAVAALEPSLRAVIVGVPVVDLSVLMYSHTPRQHRDDPRFVAMFGHATALEAVTSPIRLGVPAAPVRRIYAGKADRLVPADHVGPLVDHWGLDEPVWYTGGHLGFMTAPTVRRCVDEVLLESGLAESRGKGIHAVA